MRRGLIIAIVGGVPEVISGPAVPYGEQRLRFKQLRSDHPEAFEGAELWDSSNGRVKRVRFKPGTGNETDDDFAIEGVEGLGEPRVFEELTAEEEEFLKLFRAKKSEISGLESETEAFKAIISGLSSKIQLPEEEQPSVPGATDASGQSALPSPEANATVIGATTGPALEGQVADEDDGPTLDLPPAAQPEGGKPEAEKPAAKSHTSKSKKH